MASSRRSAKAADPVVAAVANALGAACGAASSLARPPVFVVACSGGLDSTVLLDAAARASAGRSVPFGLVAVHVHHGLQPTADDWPAHCARQSAALGVPFECQRLQTRPARGDSVEAWARQQRYAALADAARRLGALAVLTAHHADDQAETLLMRIARGTGVHGLAGIQETGLQAGVRVLRPLLALPRSALRDYAERCGLAWVEDPSNRDTRALRNAIRHRVLPAIDEAAPAFRRNLTRLAARLSEAREAVDALARIDLAAAVPSGAPGQGAAVSGTPGSAGEPDASGAPVLLDASVLAALPAARRAAAFRLWIGVLGARPPTQARLDEMQRQLLPGTGAYGCVVHEGIELRRYRHWLQAGRLASHSAAGGGGLSGAAAAVPGRLTWQGEPSLALPGFEGRLHFDAVSRGGPPGHGGVGAAWLQGRALVFGPPNMSARLRPSPGGPSRTLKNLYQARGVPAWERPRLPLVKADGRPLYAAGVGMDCSPGWPTEGPLVRLRWEPCPV